MRVAMIRIMLMMMVRTIRVETIALCVTAKVLFEMRMIERKRMKN